MNLLEQVSKIALDAGEVMLEIYNDPTQDFELDKKDDNSPLTKADLASHHSIVA
jgi:3'(2'), 5'-bisphosphate nucleotidase